MVELCWQVKMSRATTFAPLPLQETDAPFLVCPKVRRDSTSRVILQWEQLTARERTKTDLNFSGQVVAVLPSPHRWELPRYPSKPLKRLELCSIPYKRTREYLYSSCISLRISEISFFDFAIGIVVANPWMSRTVTSLRSGTGA
jgi:hypothetical protein